MSGLDMCERVAAIRYRRRSKTWSYWCLVAATVIASVVVLAEVVRVLG